MSDRKIRFDSEVRYIQTALIKPDPMNPRTHSIRQIKMLAKSIERSGYFNPILIDEDNVIIAGHGRLRAAERLGLTEVPTFRLLDLSLVEKRALMLADNKIASNAGWDRSRLAVILPTLSVDLDSAGIDVTVTGFEVGEIDQIIVDFQQADDNIEEHSDADVGHACSKAGDLWLLGPHRLLCGNSRSGIDVQRLMDGSKASMSFNDPPYNLSIKQIVGRGKIKHREFAEASGEQSDVEFVIFLGEWLDNVIAVSSPGALTYVCMDWRHVGQLIDAAKSRFPAHVNTAIWVKTNAGQGSFYRSQHEQILIFRCGDDQHRNNIELGKYGRNRSNVWTYPGVNTFRTGRLDDLRIHPTVKPVALVADAIRDCTKLNDIVLDLFCGSGTSIVAADKTGRRCFAMEIDPAYVDTTIRRWQTATGKDAILESSGSTFDELALARTGRRGAA